MKKRFDYFKYEEKINAQHLRKLSGAKTFECGLDLIEFGMESLKYSILAEKPKLSWPELKQEIKKILWHKR